MKEYSKGKERSEFSLENTSRYCSCIITAKHESAECGKTYSGHYERIL